MITIFSDFRPISAKKHFEIITLTFVYKPEAIFKNSFLTKHLKLILQYAYILQVWLAYAKDIQHDQIKFFYKNKVFK
jgi:hypothetical protein